MADLKISQLPAASTPLAGTEEVPIVQGGVTDRVAVSDLTAGRAVAASSLTVAAGAVGTPSLTTAGDTNTGVYFPAGDTVAIAVGGAQALKAEAAAVTSTVPVVHPAGTVSAPSLTTTGDLNTGVYFPAADTVAITVGGSQALKAEATALTAASPIVLPAGSASAPALTTAGDLNTGVVFSAADAVGVTTGGTQRLTVDTAALTSTLPVVHPAGAAATPSVTTAGDLNTGAWFPAADTMALSTGGSERLRVDSSGNVGIGTTSPASKLAVAGTIHSSSGGFKFPDGTTQTTAATASTPTAIDVEYLVIGGGGAGGGPYTSATAGGGGGGGAYLTSDDYITASALLGASYLVTVGAGGSSSSASTASTSGNSSRFGPIVAIGGGRGAGRTSAAFYDSEAGGSGGGASSAGTSNAGGTKGRVAGLIGFAGGGSGTNGAGGGGAGGAGAGPSSTTPGGAGSLSSITGSSVGRAGGGGGALTSTTAGSTATDGGGAGGYNNSGSAGANGTANKGGGGGGSYYQNKASGAGGSGVVILKYLSTYTATFSGGVTQSTTTSGSYKISEVTAAGATDTVTFS